MRINQFVAKATGLSRRAADAAIQAGQVTVNGSPAPIGQEVSPADSIALNGTTLHLPQQHTTIVLHKPVGYVCSRNGQGNATVYDLLPAALHSLKPVGRLDKDSSGLLVLTDDGELHQQLTHPRFAKQKIYEVVLDAPLTSSDQQAIEQGVQLDDGISKLQLKGAGNNWQVSMSEGRNRQIRRTFAALGYHVKKLHRTHFGPYSLDELPSGKFSAK